MTRILAFRFSAFGDVAMSAAILREIVSKSTEIEIIMVSKASYAALFQGIPNLQFRGVHLDEYKGFIGLQKLAKELYDEYQPDQIADLHNVLRTKIVRGFFKRRGTPVSCIHKGRKEKKKLVNVWNIDKTRLKPTTERYADVFRYLGHKVTLDHQLPVYQITKSGIGFAPFAQHEAKMLPLEHSFQLLKELAKEHRVYLFGGGKKEIEILEKWEKEVSNVYSFAGKLSIDEELSKIKALEVMISMDSANMHLASLVGTRCISVWCATHVFAGFLGYGQREEDIVQVKDLTCRPCSVFGNKKCFRGDYACIHELQIQWIFDKIKGDLENKSSK